MIEDMRGAWADGIENYGFPDLLGSWLVEHEGLIEAVAELRDRAEAGEAHATVPVHP